MEDNGWFDADEDRGGGAKPNLRSAMVLVRVEMKEMHVRCCVICFF